MATSRLVPLACAVTLWLLFRVAFLQPLHMVQEAHALFPASAQHHADLHCEGNSEELCDQLGDDVSLPLNGEEHERHHQLECTGDSQLFFAPHETVSVAPTEWHLYLLDFAPAAANPQLEVPASPRQSRAPPCSERVPHSASYSPQLGRAPPVEA